MTEERKTMQDQPGAPKALRSDLTPEGVFAARDTQGDRIDRFWKSVEKDPRAWNEDTRGYDRLIERAADADREDLRRALGWLEAALAQRDRMAAVAACRYLAAMPEPLLASDYARILTIFNSRLVGMVWCLTPDLDRTPLPRAEIPVFGIEAGFGLIRHAPELYRKLAMLGPELEEVVIGLVEEAARYDISLPPDLVTLAKGRVKPSRE